MKNGMLNSNLKYMLARMGHRDLLAVTDAGYNILIICDIPFCLFSII